MDEFGTSPRKDPQAAACLGFVFAAISGAFGMVAWMHWKMWDEIMEGMPLGMRSGGGMAFSMNLPGLAMEFAAYAFALAGFAAIGGVCLWRPALFRSLYSVAGLLCLVPAIALLTARLGWLSHWR